MKLNLFATLLAVGSMSFSAMGGAILSYTSSPNSWVGRGQTMTFSPANGDNLLVLSETGFLNVLINGGNWDLELGTPDGSPFAVGLYSNAQRSGPQPGIPFMEFGGAGRGNDVDTGWFNVLAVTQTDGVINSMAVDFLQYDEGDPNNWVLGSFRYNSSIPLLPEPSEWTLLMLGGIGLFYTRCKRKRASPCR